MEDNDELTTNNVKLKTTCYPNTRKKTDIIKSDHAFLFQTMQLVYCQSNQYFDIFVFFTLTTFINKVRRLRFHMFPEALTFEFFLVHTA